MHTDSIAPTQLSPASGAASLSERERRFVEAYMGPAAGNGTEAARLAGYKGSANVLHVQSNRLLRKATVQTEIETRRRVLSAASIADAKERREVLTAIIRSVETDPNARIRAIDVANKMDGLYVEKHQHDVGPTLAQLLTGGTPA